MLVKSALLQEYTVYEDVFEYALKNKPEKKLFQYFTKPKR
jgi:hypothetical protein